MCAAETSGAAVMKHNPLAHVTPNIVMNAQMLEAAYRNGVKHFVFISSSTVYHDTGETPTAEYHLRYDRPPHSSYYLVGWMKRYSEILCYSYARAVSNPMKVTVVRPGNIYGPWGKFNPETSHMTAAMVRRVAERQDPIEVWGTGDDIRDLIYVDDFITGLLAATAHTEDYFVVNLASGVGHTVNDVLYTLLGLEDYNPKVLYDPTKPSTIPVRLLDTDRMRYVLGFQPTMTLAEGLDRTLSWYKENRDTWMR